MQNQSPQSPAIDWRAVLVVALLPAGILIWLAVRAPEAFTIFVYALGTLTIAAIAVLVYGLYNRWAGKPAAYADKEIRHTQAKVQVAPLAHTYHHHTETHAIAGDAPALQAPADVVKPLDAWMGWLDAQPHTLLSGRTKSGKTTTATAILSRRLRAGETAYLIDPHSSGWMGLPTVGFVGMLPDGKPDTADLNKALMAVAGEYIRRMKARDDHKTATGAELPHDHFGRMTILIDEANYIADALPTIWREFIKALASGGRKVGISLVCLVQSPLVEDIGCSGGMRANFARLGLDDYTIKQLIGSDEKDGERKKALNAALIGMAYPAGATIDSQVWLLARGNLDAGSAPSNARALVWTGKPSSLSAVPPVPDSRENGNESSMLVPAPGANSSMVPSVPTAAEIATIAARLGTGTPSQVAKTLDGYHARKHDAYKAKVEYVQQLLRGESV
jgi:hypothetical protein